jgi:flavin-dependent dehydrogenase
MRRSRGRWRSNRVHGGGLAGTARKRVVLLEKERFPRFHIGESLLPLNLPCSNASAWPTRFGAWRYTSLVLKSSQTSTARRRSFVSPTIRSLTVKHAYQVKRADFDKLLLDNSRRCGATVQEGVRVTDIALMPGARAKVTGAIPTVRLASGCRVSSSTLLVVTPCWPTASRLR